MTRVVVPVRYPLTAHSKRTLREAVRIGEAEDAQLTVLHVDLYQTPGEVRPADLRRAVETAVGRLPEARFAVRQGFMVEETILEEVAGEDADIVVIGHKQVGRWQSTIRRLIGDPDIDTFLREELDCRVVTVGA